MLTPVTPVPVFLLLKQILNGNRFRERSCQTCISLRLTTITIELEMMQVPDGVLSVAADLCQSMSSVYSVHCIYYGHIYLENNSIIDIVNCWQLSDLG